MKAYTEANLNKLNILPHNIAFCYTSESDYDMSRIIILTDFGDQEYGFLVLNGGHCSCYDFDETSWDGMMYTRNELKKLAMAKGESEYDINEAKFWGIVAKNI